MATDPNEWKTRGLCHDHPTLTPDDWFFESKPAQGRPSNEARKAKAKHIAMLKAMCDSCPVLAECRAGSRYEPYGFRAGMTECERNNGHLCGG